MILGVADFVSRIG